MRLCFSRGQCLLAEMTEMVSESPSDLLRLSSRKLVSVCLAKCSRGVGINGRAKALLLSSALYLLVWIKLPPNEAYPFIQARRRAAT